MRGNEAMLLRYAELGWSHEAALAALFEPEAAEAVASGAVARIATAGRVSP
jgi:hypothetical protein